VSECHLARQICTVASDLLATAQLAVAIEGGHVLFCGYESY